MRPARSIIRTIARSRSRCGARKIPGLEEPTEPSRARHVSLNCPDERMAEFDRIFGCNLGKPRCRDVAGLTISARWIGASLCNRRRAMPANHSASGTSSTLSLPSSSGRGTCSGTCLGPVGGESGRGSGGALAMITPANGTFEKRPATRAVPAKHSGRAAKPHARPQNLSRMV